MAAGRHDGRGTSGAGTFRRGPETHGHGRKRVLNFHGTRHTYISGIVAGGASVKTCQTGPAFHPDADNRAVFSHSVTRPDRGS